MKTKPIRNISLYASLAVLCAALLAPQPAPAQVDVTPPEIVDFTFTPAAIDVSAGAQAVTATLQLTDDLSGASFAQVRFTSPLNQSQFVFAFLTAGTRQDGTFQGSVEFPRFSENGTWTVTNVFIRDLTGNSASFNTATLSAAGFPTELEVVSVPADTSGPTVASLGIAPSPVDVSAGAQTLTIDLGLEDDLSGVIFAPAPSGSFFSFSAIGLRSPSGAQQRQLRSSSFSLDPAGSPQSGTWSADLLLPQFSEAGTWQVSFVQARDVAGNFSFLRTADLQALGVQTEIEVVSSPADTAPPELTTFGFSPLLIDTTSGSQVVTVTMRITDDLAGTLFGSSSVTGDFLFAGVIFRSPSGGQARSTTAFSLVSGDALGGFWRGDVFFPQFSEAGTWRADVFLKDAAGNRDFLNSNALVAAGFDPQLVVILPSLEGDGTIDDPAAGGTVMDEVFGDRAQVTFPPGVLTQPTSVAIDVFEDPLDVPLPAGFMADGTRFVNIDLDPEPGFPLPPPGLTVVLPLIDPLPAGSILTLFRIDEATGQLVAATDANTGLPPVTGAVAADGLSATFTGIASLSVVVGLLPDTVPFEAFAAELEIEDDEVELEGRFWLGTGSNGIDLAVDDLTLQIGSYAITVPAGSFEIDDDEFEFEGRIDGAEVELELSSRRGDRFDIEFEAEGVDVSVAGSGNPVDVTLTIGDDTGTISVDAELDD